MILLVAAVAAGTGRPAPSRLHGGDVVSVDCGEVTCVGVSLGALPPLEVGVLVHHDAAVRALMSSGPVVPFRYGTTVPGVSELRRDLGRWERRLVEMLHLVEGRVEMAVRVTNSATLVDGPEPASGREYLAALRRRRGPGAFPPALHRELIRLSVASETSSSHGSVSGAYLIGRADEGAFRRTVEEATAGAVLERVSVTGPWPPYSFVGSSLAAAVSEPEEVRA